MAQYNPDILQKYADMLYARANRIIASYTILGGLLGTAASYLLAHADRTPGNIDPLYITIGGGLLLGVIGFAIGSARAFMLKLQAQLALCQRQIEMNTRKS